MSNVSTTECRMSWWSKFRKSNLVCLCIRMLNVVWLNIRMSTVVCLDFKCQMSNAVWLKRYVECRVNDYTNVNVLLLDIRESRKPCGSTFECRMSCGSICNVMWLSIRMSNVVWLNIPLLNSSVFVSKEQRIISQLHAAIQTRDPWVTLLTKARVGEQVRFCNINPFALRTCTLNFQSSVLQ